MPQRKDSRPEDPVFAGNEQLFRRFNSGHYVGGMLMPAALSFPRQSFVRSKYAVPTDVLDPACANGRDYAAWGILAIAVEDIPSEVRAENCPSFEFWPKHEPIEECYAHTELWCNRTGQNHGVYKEPPTTIKTSFRALMSQRLRVVKQSDA